MERKNSLLLAVIMILCVLLGVLLQKESVQVNQNVEITTKIPRIEEKININSASKKALMFLPGVGEKKATRIIKNRPYSSKLDALRVLTKELYISIEDKIKTK